MPTTVRMPRLPWMTGIDRSSCSARVSASASRRGQPSMALPSRLNGRRVLPADWLIVRSRSSRAAVVPAPRKRIRLPTTRLRTRWQATAARPIFGVRRGPSVILMQAISVSPCGSPSRGLPMVPLRPASTTSRLRSITRQRAPVPIRTPVPSRRLALPGRPRSAAALCHRLLSTSPPGPPLAICCWPKSRPSAPARPPAAPSRPRRAGPRSAAIPGTLITRGPRMTRASTSICTGKKRRPPRAALPSIFPVQPMRTARSWLIAAPAPPTPSLLRRGRATPRAPASPRRR